MKWFLFFAFSFYGFANAQCDHIRTVMVTGFEPFMGNTVNHSQLAAEALGKSDPNKTCVRFQACILPVEYEKGAAKAVECFEKASPKPDLVMSMGEGDCSVRIETRGHNLNNTPGFADNAGVVKNNELIDEDGAEDNLITLPVPAMYCATKAAVGRPTTVSTTPGFYVCNDVAYRLAKYFKGEKIPFGFIHVPSSMCGKTDPLETADKITLMARAAIRQLAVTETIFKEKFSENCPRGSNEMVYSTVKQDMMPLSQLITASCRAEVLNKLKVKADNFRKVRKATSGDVQRPSK